MRIAAVVCAAAILVAAACTDGGGTTEPPDESFRVMLAPDSVLLTVPDEQVFVNAHVIDDDGVPQAEMTEIRWTSRDRGIAWIDEGVIGAPLKIHARANGATWVVATADGAAADSIRVQVSVPVYSDLPVWRFTVAAGARTSMPLSQFEVIADVHVKYLNQEFNKGGFRGRFEFVLDSAFTYAETSTLEPREIMKRPRSAQYLILYDPKSSALTGGGQFFQDGQSIQITLADFATNAGASFAVTHEMGHARGALDIYNYTIPPDAEGRMYLLPESFMSAGGRRWDPLSQILIDDNAGKFPSSPEGTWVASMFPEKIGVRVVDRAGNPVPSAEVIFHKAKGDIWGNASPDIVARGFTDASGAFAPSFNPFDGPIDRGPPGYWCAFYGCLYLVLKVEVRHEGVSTWGYMTAADAVVARNRAGPVYLRKIRLGAPPS